MQQVLRTVPARIALALAAGMILYLVVSRILASRQTAREVAAVKPPPPIVRYQATQFIAAHTVISPAMVKEYDLQDADKPQQGQPIPAEWITTRDDLVWHVARQNILPGTKLERGMVGGRLGDEGLGALIPYGLRAMTVTIKREASQMTQYMVNPGDRIDILATFKDDKYTATVVEDVPVIAADVYAVGRDKEHGNVAQRGPYVPRTASRARAGPTAPDGTPLAQTPPPGSPEATAEAEQPAAAKAKAEAPAKAPDGGKAPSSGLRSPRIPPPKLHTITVGVTPEQVQVLAIAEAYGELDFVVRSREEAAPLSAGPATTRRGLHLNDLSPHLGRARREVIPGEGRRLARPNVRALPRAPRVTLLPPSIVPKLESRLAPTEGGAQPTVNERPERRAVGHKIEVYAPGGVRVVEVPRE